MSYSKDEKDWLGRDRKVHYDDQGNKVGTSKDEKDWLGRERTAHFDSSGNKTGISKEEKDWLGNNRTVHYDEDGNKKGVSKVEKDWKGDEVIQHYDKSGNKTGQSKYEKDWLGRRILKHRSSSDGGNKAIGVLILLALVVFLVLGTFSYPYKMIDPAISPFKLNWLDNKNVWIFCVSIWTLLVTLILSLKLTLGNKNGEKPNSYIVENGLVTILIFLASLAIVTSYVIKAKFTTDFLLYSIIISGILLLVFGLAFWKTSKAIYTLLTFGIISACSIYFLHNELGLKAESISQSSPDQGGIINNSSQEAQSFNNSAASYTVDAQDAEDQFKRFNNALLNRDMDQLNGILSDRLTDYMKMKNISKEFVIQDKTSYLKKWNLYEYSIKSFTRENEHAFNYKILTRLNKTEDEGYKRDFVIAGQIVFDEQNKINAMIDQETISLHVAKPIYTNTLSEIAGTSWTMQGSQISPFYITFNEDGSFVINLVKDETYTWRLQEEQLVFQIGDISTATCMLENGNLFCNGNTSSGEQWTMEGLRKK